MVPGAHGPGLVALEAGDELLGVAVEDPLEDGAVEVLLVAEIVVEQPLVGPGQGGNGIHPRALKAALGKFGPPGNEDRRLGLGRIARPLGRRWFGGLVHFPSHVNGPVTRRLLGITAPAGRVNGTVRQATRTSSMTA